MTTMQTAQRITSDEYLALDLEGRRTQLVDGQIVMNEPRLLHQVEIRSPSTWRYDVGTKKSVYEREGLPELWLVDGEGRVVLVFRRSSPRAPTFDIELELDAAALLQSPQLPDFALALGELFERS
ncbi:MAG: Uma2 family endonuclease [Solirubrobacteraceae bacterium]